MSYMHLSCALITLTNNAERMLLFIGVLSETNVQEVLGRYLSAEAFQGISVGSR